MEQEPIDLVVDHEQRDGLTLIRVRGELDLHTSAALQNEIERMLPFRSPVTIDLAEVDFVDSTGIRSLLTLNSQALESTGRELRVQGASDVSRRLFALTGVDRVFTVVD